MFDIDGLKQQTDLLAICGHDTQLKRVASTGGGEWAGPCPMCGGKDRFRVQPYMNIWMCHYCTHNVWKDVISYVEMREHVDFKTAIKSLGGDEWQRSDIRRQAPEPRPAYQSPDEAWQVASAEVIKTCEANLWGNTDQRALNWLHKRGLTDDTIKSRRLGFSTGGNIAGLYVTYGITIPCMVGGVVWYIKIRTNSNESGKKYKGVKGNKTAAIYGADDMRGDKVLFCEGEFDCMLSNQELGNIIPSVTLGSAVNMPDLGTWGVYLLPIKTAFIAYDLDTAGEKGAVKLLDLLGNRGQYALLPTGDWKDITDYYKAGGGLWDWIKVYLENYYPEEV